MLGHGMLQTQEIPKFFLNKDNLRLYKCNSWKNQPPHEWGVSPFFPDDSQRSWMVSCQTSGLADGCMQSLFNFHAGIEVSIKVFLLQNSLHNWAFNMHISLGRKTHHKQTETAEVWMTAVFAVQTLFLCQEFIGIILNELWSRNLFHLAHLNVVLKSHFYKSTLNHYFNALFM